MNVGGLSDNRNMTHTPPPHDPNAGAPGDAGEPDVAPRPRKSRVRFTEVNGGGTAIPSGGARTQEVGVQIDLVIDYIGHWHGGTGHSHLTELTKPVACHSSPASTKGDALRELTEEWQHLQLKIARDQAESARVLAELLDLAHRVDHADQIDHAEVARSPESFEDRAESLEECPEQPGDCDSGDAAPEPLQTTPDSGLAVRSFAAELALSINLSDRTIMRQLDEAHTLVTRFPETMRALEHGTVQMAHAKVIMNEGLELSPPEQADYELRVLKVATQTTPGRLRSHARRIADNVRPKSLQERHDEAAQCRMVAVRELSDGMAELTATMPAPLAYGIFDRLTRGARLAKQQAKDIRTVSDVGADAVTDAGTNARTNTNFSVNANSGVSADDNTNASSSTQPTLAQLRTDILAELLLTGVPASDANASPGRNLVGIVPQITLNIPVGAVAEHAELGRYGPIDSDLARQFMAVAPGWDRISLDPDNTVLATDRYRPTEAIRRVLRARDGHCRFPGCLSPVSQCDIDHTLEWVNDGRTEVSNLAHLCRTHHMLKHPDLSAEIKWKVKQQAGGELWWIGPTGHTYTDKTERALASEAAEVALPRSDPPPAPPPDLLPVPPPDPPPSPPAETAALSGPLDAAQTPPHVELTRPHSGEVPPDDSEAVPY